MLAYWYSHQELCVRWNSSVSGFFTTSNGTWQGGILSPFLFCRYIRDLLHDIAQAGIGCNIGGVFINILAYADDIVLLAPSWRAMQDLLVILESHTVKIDMKCNESKTVCMVFQPKRRSQIVSMSFPQLTLCNFCVQYVVSFKYLGHIIFSNRKDNDDIQREIRNMFMRTNLLVRRFIKCSHEVKLVLFRAYCICLYDACLWSNYDTGCLTKLKLCYHKCIKMFFGYRRCDSVTEILFMLGLPSFDTLLHNSRVVFLHAWSKCPNMLVSHMQQVVPCKCF